MRCGGALSLSFSAEDIVLIYAGQLMADELALREYHVPPVRALSRNTPLYTRTTSV